MKTKSIEVYKLSKVFKRNIAKKGLNAQYESFYALKDIDFSVNEGDSFALIGANGSGKSTLLKILSKILAPTSGTFSYRGKLSALLEVGAGFHPELSGLDNIYLSGSLLGLSKNDVAKVEEEIIDFSGIEDFIYSPVKNYSSGMYVRLAFAVGAHIQSDILLVDEILAVGDAQFQKKCIEKIQSINENHSKTIVMVSHNQGLLNKLCNRGILLNKGEKIAEGNIDYLLSSYTQLQKNTLRKQPELREGSGVIRVENFILNKAKINQNEILAFELNLESSSPIDLNKTQIRVNLLDENGNFVTSFNPEFNDEPLQLNKNIVKLKCEIPSLNLVEGQYIFRIHIWHEGISADRLLHAGEIEVVNPTFNLSPKSIIPLKQGVVLTQKWNEI